MAPLLQIRNLVAALSGRTVLHGVDCTVAAGEFVGLIGPNGAGKSTLLRAALGLLPASGVVTIAGRDSAALRARDRARLAAYLPQERDIAWPMTVQTLVGLGREPYRSALAPAGRQDEAAVSEAMARMQIENLATRRATELSGGERARALIARALAQQAPLLLADEPTAGLDPSHQIALMRIFSDLAAEGHGVLASMHDLGLAGRWCHRLILIDHGRVIADGAPAEVLTLARLREIYGVEAFRMETADGLLLLPLDLAQPR